MAGTIPHGTRKNAIVLLVLTAGAVGFDLLTPASSEPGLFYLPAVVLGAWRFGAVAALLLSLVAVSVRLIGDSQAATLSAVWSASSWLSAHLVVGISVVLLRRSIARERRSARTDRLTGLANRTALLESIEAELNRGRREESPMSVAYLDCDNFKQVNDQQGHSVGDRVLQAAATAMKQATRNYDLVARPGGDEFVVVLPNTRAEGARVVIDRIRQKWATVMQENEWNVSFSIGVATFIDLPKSAEEAIAAADELMYQIKHTSKNDVRYESFGQELSADAH